MGCKANVSREIFDNLFIYLFIIIVTFFCVVAVAVEKRSL